MKAKTSIIKEKSFDERLYNQKLDSYLLPYNYFHLPTLLKQFQLVLSKMQKESFTEFQIQELNQFLETILSSEDFILFIKKILQHQKIYYVDPLISFKIYYVYLEAEDIANFIFSKISLVNELISFPPLAISMFELLLCDSNWEQLEWKI